MPYIYWQEKVEIALYITCHRQELYSLIFEWHAKGGAMPTFKTFNKKTTMIHNTLHLLHQIRRQKETKKMQKKKECKKRETNDDDDDELREAFSSMYDKR